MLRNALSMLLDLVFLVILRTELFTDRAHMPDGKIHEWKHSPISRLYMADKPFLLYLQFAFMILSAVTSLLLLFGAKNSTIKTVQLVSTAASAVLFVIILIVTAGIHGHY